MKKIKLNEYEIKNILKSVGILAAGGLAIKIHNNNFKRIREDISKSYKNLQYNEEIMPMNYDKFERIKNDLCNAKSSVEMDILLSLINECAFEDLPKFTTSNKALNEELVETVCTPLKPFPEEDDIPDDGLGYVDEGERPDPDDDDDCDGEPIVDNGITTVPENISMAQEKGLESDPINRISDNLMYLCDDTHVKLDSFITFLEKMAELKDENKDLFDKFVDKAEEIIAIEDDDEQAIEFNKLITEVNENRTYSRKRRAQNSR